MAINLGNRLGIWGPPNVSVAFGQALFLENGNHGRIQRILKEEYGWACILKWQITSFHVCECRRHSLGLSVHCFRTECFFQGTGGHSTPGPVPEGGGAPRRPRTVPSLWHILSHVLLRCDEAHYLFLKLRNKSQKKCLKRKAPPFSVSRILGRIFKVLALDEGISVFSLFTDLLLSFLW